MVSSLPVSVGRSWRQTLRVSFIIYCVEIIKWRVERDQRGVVISSRVVFHASAAHSLRAGNRRILSKALRLEISSDSS